MANTICILTFRIAVNLANYDNANRGYYQKSTLEAKHLETVAKIFKEFGEDMRRTHSSRNCQESKPISRILHLASVFYVSATTMRSTSARV